MFKRLRRWFYGKIADIAYWLGTKDVCELCGDDIADGGCVGCEKRICMNCDSGYYDDETLCKDCRAKITPEEEESDRVEMANFLKTECTCPKQFYTGSEPNDSTCELSDDEHDHIRQYASKEQA
jgi:hypothetical protein